MRRWPLSRQSRPSRPAPTRYPAGPQTQPGPKLSRASNARLSLPRVYTPSLKPTLTPGLYPRLLSDEPHARAPRAWQLSFRLSKEVMSSDSAIELPAENPLAAVAVLVVDDSDFVRELTASLVQRATSGRVETASDGAEVRSHFLLVTCYFLLLASYFLLLASCFVLLASYFSGVPDADERRDVRSGAGRPAYAG